jgi:hypothetical protein
MEKKKMEKKKRGEIENKQRKRRGWEKRYELESGWTCNLTSLSVMLIVWLSVYLFFDQRNAIEILLDERLKFRDTISQYPIQRAKKLL